MVAEFFNQKGISFGTGIFAKTDPLNATTIDTVAAFHLANMAAEDAGIAVWQSKRYYDAVSFYIRLCDGAVWLSVLCWSCNDLRPCTLLAFSSKKLVQ